jgi:hypothetical protein
MRSLLLSAALAALLVACSPPAQSDAEAPSPDPEPQVQACNDVAPNLTRLVRVEEALAVSAAASDLRGGSISPGDYDLTRAVRVGQATGWQGEQAVALNVTEDANGVTFNWASGAPGGAIDRWTAGFSDAGEHPIVTYSCGRVGTVAVEFTAQQNALTLRVRDGANGSLQLDFARRS